MVYHTATMKKIRLFFVLLCIITFSISLLISYTIDELAFYFFKYTFCSSSVLCACNQCMAVLDDDPWFTERFNQTVQPLMTRENSVLAEDTFQWWKWLQQGGMSSNFTDVVDELFQLIPNQVLYNDASPKRCRTCAVVGNSRNLRGSRYGSLIDANHFIIRMNRAIMHGFEDDVGTRTTHHVMYPESAVDLDNDTSLVLVPFKILDMQWMISALTTGTIHHTYTHVMSKIKANRDKVMIYNPAFFKYTYDNWLDGHGRYPSTGFLSLLFAIHICDEVSVFGFGADKDGNWHHYWETNHLAGAHRQTGIHDGDYEYNVTLLLADKHKIKMFKGR